MHRTLRFASVFSALLWAALPVEAAGPEGRWITASGNLEVEIGPCGPVLCGKVTQVLANHSMAPGGREMAPADSRPALGMTLLHDLVAETTDADGMPTRWAGHLYNRENGKTYRCHVTPTGDTLTVRAYVGLPLFGQTLVWPRSTLR